MYGSFVNKRAEINHYEKNKVFSFICSYLLKAWDEWDYAMECPSIDKRNRGSYQCCRYEIDSWEGELGKTLIREFIHNFNTSIL